MKNYEMEMVKELLVVTFFMVCQMGLFVALLAVFGTAG